jgi:hypothetical protein
MNDRLLESLVLLFGPAKTDDARFFQPVPGLPVSVVLPHSDGQARAGTIVGLLQNERGRRVALVRVPNGPSTYDLPAPWYTARPGQDEAAEIGAFPLALQVVCFPKEGGVPDPPNLDPR